MELTPQSRVHIHVYFSVCSQCVLFFMFTAVYGVMLCAPVKLI